MRRYEAALAHSSFRFFDGEMYYTEPQLHILIRALQRSTTREREVSTLAPPVPRMQTCTHTHTHSALLALAR